MDLIGVDPEVLVCVVCGVRLVRDVRHEVASGVLRDQQRMGAHVRRGHVHVLNVLERTLELSGRGCLRDSGGVRGALLLMMLLLPVVDCCGSRHADRCQLRPCVYV